MDYKDKRIFRSLALISILLLVTACTSNKSDSNIRANEVLNRDNQGFIGQEVQDTSL